MEFRVRVGKEEDGRWFGEAPDLPGVFVYAPSRDEALRRAACLALNVLSDRIAHGELSPEHGLSLRIAA